MAENILGVQVIVGFTGVILLLLGFKFKINFGSSYLFLMCIGIVVVLQFMKPMIVEMDKTINAFTESSSHSFERKE